MDVLTPQSWMRRPETGRVVAALEAAGGPGAARFVGGCVRDALLMRPVDDIDLATPLTPDRVISALVAAGLKAVPTGIEHGTVTAVADGRPFEITTLRRDVSTDGRRAVVAFTTDWSEDAQRRDFTLNALYLAPDGEIFDPTGRGISDARAGRIVFVGRPELRIREDFLRILRFFRFSAWYASGPPDPEALAACARERAGLRSLSAERISRELLKLLAAPDPRPAVRAMAASGVLQVLIPEAAALDRFEGLVEVDREMFAPPDAPLRLLALLPADGGTVAALARRLRLPKAMEARLLAAAGEEIRLVSWMSPREIRRALYRLGPEVFKDRVRLAWAASSRPAAFVQWRMLLAYADTWTPPSLPLNGEEILAAGVPSGPLIGAVMKEVEDWWVDLDFIDDKLALIERLKAVAQGLAY